MLSQQKEYCISANNLIASELSSVLNVADEILRHNKPLGAKD